jgi:hypothetical protein
VRASPRGEVVGRLPVTQDFTDAAKLVNEGEFNPTVRQGVVGLFENQGLHPAEIAHDAQTDPNIGAALKAGQVPERYAVPEAPPIQPSPHQATEAQAALPKPPEPPAEGRIVAPKFDPEPKITEDAIPLERPPVTATDLEPIAGAGRRGGGRLPPPPRQGMNDDDFYRGPPLQRQPQPRPPYFTYDDSNAFAKFYRGAIDQWQKTFQPELVSEKAMMADPRFAEYKTAVQEKRDQIVINAEQDHQYWRGQSEADRLKYIELMESPRADVKVPPEWADRFETDRATLDKVAGLEKEAGSQGSFFENYFPHIFQNPVQAREWVAGRVAQLGPTWFTKQRTFMTVREAMDAGLRLKTDNPADLISHRLFSSADMLERIRLLQDFKGMNLAVEAETANAERAARIKFAQRMGLPIDVTTVGRNLADDGWTPINGPDGKQWLIPPDLKPLWQNAIDAKGLWANEGNIGSAFRGWMAFKNVWMPIKLALSAFHPLHVLHLNAMQDLYRAARLAANGEYGAALREVGDTIADPFRAALPWITSEGRIARQAWQIPEDARTPFQNLLVQTMKEGGLVPGISEELKIQSRRAWEKAWDNSEWFRGLPQLLREGVRLAQYPVFEAWIPNLKVSAYLRDAALHLSQHPELIDDKVQRQVALRTIAKATENRYGQMFYGNLFWDRMVKDISIGSMISLGWNTGFVRWAGGGFGGPFFRAIRNIQRPMTKTELTAQEANSNLGTFMTYAVGAMALNGAITYLMSGETPEGLDYFLPRTGRNNPDGTPHRLTNMFYTREIPMAKAHIERRGGNIVSGLADTAASKGVLEPAKELIENRDYYGNNIYNENSPLYQRAVQYLEHVFSNQFNPISVTAARQALRSGGGWGEAAAAFAGFGPAPAYANRDALYNRISYLYQEHVAPAARTAEAGEKATEKTNIRTELLLAKQRGDQAAMKDATQRWFKAGGSAQGLSNIMLGVDPKISMFRALPEEDQKAILEQAGPADRQMLTPYLKTNYPNKIADMMVDAKNAEAAGDEATAAALHGKIQEMTKRAVAEGHVNNMNAFKRSIAKQLQFRYAPEIGAMLTQPKAKRKVLQPQPALGQNPAEAE